MARGADKIVVEGRRTVWILAIPDDRIVLGHKGGEIRHHLREAVTNGDLEALAGIHTQDQRFEGVVLGHFDRTARVGHTTAAVATHATVYR